MKSLFLVATFAVVSPVFGQSSQQLPASAPAGVEADESAERLLEQAYELFEHKPSWQRAARLIERSAKLRAVDHPRRAETFTLAGRIYYSAGALGSAQRSLELAGESALQVGAVADAATAYLDAAQVAALRNDVKSAHALVRKAQLLASSPHLDGSNRQAIAARIPPQLRAG